MPDKASAVLVIGAGVGGLRASLDLAESGFKVYLCERNPGIGGTLVQLDKWFPDNRCGMCKMLPVFSRDQCSQSCLRQGLVHPNIELLPMSEVERVEGEAGNFVATLKSRPSGVDPDLCIGCGLCTQACPVEAPSEFNQGLDKRKAIYLWHPLLLAGCYVIDWDSCTKCGVCVQRCPTDAINLSRQRKTRRLEVGAVVLATGFEEYDARLSPQYGYGRYPNVVTSIELERILSPTGPTGGRLVRPSDGKPPRTIAFLQCVGSRDTRRDYCSSACCMYSIKEATLIKKADPDTAVSIFFMDVRAFGKGYHRYYEEARDKLGVIFTHCRIPVVKQDPRTKDLLVTSVMEDSRLHQQRFDLVVLAIGQTPAPQFAELSRTLGVEQNRWGFCWTPPFSTVKTSRPGVYVCGSASAPKDIADTSIEASAAACEVSGLLSQKRTVRVSEGSLEGSGAVEEDPRTAVFLCRCDGKDGSGVDMKEMVGFACGLPSVVGVEEMPRLCQKGGLEKVRERVEALRANRVVLGACIPFLRKKLSWEIARSVGVNPVLLHTVSLGGIEGSEGDRGKTAMSRDKSLVAMGVERIRLERPLPNSAISVSPSALVVGGGLAGLVSALSLADQGIEVHLVERSNSLGGNLRDTYSTLGGGDPQALLMDITQRVRTHPRIHVYIETAIAEAIGCAGDFDVALKGADGAARPPLKVGAVIIATGGGESTPREYLYGENQRVITQGELDRRLARGELGGEDVGTVVMIQCVGSRDKERPYCSRVCCSRALNNALRLKEQNPKAKVFVLYRDMMSYGFNEEYYSKARETGIIFIRYELEKKPEVKLEDNKLTVRVMEPALKGMLSLEPDLVVLSPALVPGDQSELVQMLGLELTEDGFFKEAEVKFRPVDFIKDGIFVCGLAHSPRSIDETIAQAQAAAQRAASLLVQGQLRSASVVSEVNERRCSGCEVCIAVCPYGARVKDEERGVVVVLEALCQGCGACAAACPSGAAKLREFSEKQIFSMLDAVV